MSTVRADLKYSVEHEWTDGGSPATIGVTQVAADALGDVVYVDLPEAGATVTAGEVCGEIESTKSVSDLFSPVTGEVVEVNQAVINNPTLINNNPYGEAWLFRVAVAEEGPLLSADEYAAQNDATVG